MKRKTTSNDDMLGAQLGNLAEIKFRMRHITRCIAKDYLVPIHVDARNSYKGLILQVQFRMRKIIHRFIAHYLFPLIVMKSTQSEMTIQLPL